MHLLSDFDLSKNDVEEILALSEKIKATPADYGDSMKNKTLIMPVSYTHLTLPTILLV